MLFYPGFNQIIALSDQPQPESASWCKPVAVGKTYQSLITKETEGVVQDICGSDWAPYFKSFGRLVIPRVLQARFKFEPSLDGNRPLVQVNGAEVENYSVEGDEVVFDWTHMPQPNDQVFISDRASVKGP